MEVSIANELLRPLLVGRIFQYYSGLKSLPYQSQREFYGSTLKKKFVLLSAKEMEYLNGVSEMNYEFQSNPM